MPKKLDEPPITFPGIVNIKVMQESISQALMTQAVIDTPGLDKISFVILQMIWK